MSIQPNTMNIPRSHRGRKLCFKALNIIDVQFVMGMIAVMLDIVFFHVIIFAILLQPMLVLSNESLVKYFCLHG